MQLKDLDIAKVAPGLLKRSTTSGEAHFLVPEQNPQILVPEQGAGIIFSLENTSPYVSTFRGESLKAGVRFQEPLGPNSLRRIYVPHASDYLLSTEHRLKVSNIELLHSVDLRLFDVISMPSPSIKIVSEAGSYTPDKQWKATGVTNVFYSMNMVEKDLVAIKLKGSGVVIRLGEMRMMASRQLEFLTPAFEAIKNISIGCSTQYEFVTSYLQRKYINPAYVSPEASLWALPNEEMS